MTCLASKHSLLKLQASLLIFKIPSQPFNPTQLFPTSRNACTKLARRQREREPERGRASERRASESQRDRDRERERERVPHYGDRRPNATQGVQSRRVSRLGPKATFLSRRTLRSDIRKSHINRSPKPVAPSSVL